MNKLHKLTILTFVAILSFNAYTKCSPKEAIAPFKQELEKDYFDGQNITFKLLLNGPAISSGKFFFVADDAKWSGAVILDLAKCKMTTDGNWVIWRTVDDQGNY